MLHPAVITRLNEIEKIEVDTHAAALQIIDKQGPLKNPADPRSLSAIHDSHRTPAWHFASFRL